MLTPSEVAAVQLLRNLADAIEKEEAHVTKVSSQVLPSLLTNDLYDRVGPMFTSRLEVETHIRTPKSDC